MLDNLNPRVALPEDGPTVTHVVTLAFATDPLWSWAMGREDGHTDHHALIWAIDVEGALRYPNSWILSDGAAVSVWIPPGESELSEDQEGRIRDVAAQALGPRAGRFVGVLEALEAAHPRNEDHYYLSLLGTHPDSRGRGLGMTLLAHDLAVIDASHAPAYLESSNPANDARYRSVGFEPRGSFVAPGGGPSVTTMWRPAH